MKTSKNTKSTGVNPPNSRQVNEVLNFDLSPIRKRLQAQSLLSESLIDLALLEYRRFMALVALEKKMFPMCSPEIDEVWHTHLLFTRNYSQFCERVFGEFLHHEPELSSIAPRHRDFKGFFAAYERWFGMPSPLWTKIADRKGKLCTPTQLCTPTKGNLPTRL